MNVDPHEYHQLIEGPTQLEDATPLGWQWAGVCKCGQQFRGITEEDIYTKAQLHINRHNHTDDRGEDAA